jgi:hypothetical protein
MARKKSKRNAIQKAERTLLFTVPPAASAEGNGSLFYVDTARELSKVNRKLISQGKCFGIESVEFYFTGQTGAASILVQAATASDNWVVNNAHVKGEALWHQMNELVLEDNPSIKGKWADYKVRLDAGQTIARTLSCQDGAGVEYLAGEWDYSLYVMPQHDVDPVTGLPIPAVEVSPVLIGPDTTAFRSLVNAYALSRATVQPQDPNVPGALASSFFNLLTDSGSQEPELATVIVADNDEPPYDQDVYPGMDNGVGFVNAEHPIDQGVAVATIGAPIGRIGSFVAPCGLIRFKVTAFDVNGAALSSNVEMQMKISVMAGKYKGIAAIDMGQ